ncbi:MULTISPECIES: LexA family protein [Aphanothece]|uniref:LexA family protein n=1 Tax=Aphanothece TaxID=1121 RepID=UPI00398F5D34
MVDSSRGHPAPPYPLQRGDRPEPTAPPALNLQHLLVSHPEATLLLRVSGDSMRGAGIQHGDLLVVNRRLEPRPGQVVVALLNGGFTVKRLAAAGPRRWLEPAHPAYPPLPLCGHDDGRIWGVATHVIHRC